MQFPAVCPEIPVLDLPASLAWYKEKACLQLHPCKT